MSLTSLILGIVIGVVIATPFAWFIGRQKSVLLQGKVQSLEERNESLETATRQIAAAMGKGQTRGQYGEMQLEQLLKHAGLLEGTHFKRQDSRTSDMIFNINHCVWYISQFMELKAGDIINTGTPEGVGMGHKPEKYLKAGQVVETGIDGLGIIKSKVVSHK